MRVMEALTKLVIGMSRFGDHLLKQKVGGIIVASLAFACGAGLAHALKGEPPQDAPACAPLHVEVRTQNSQGKFNSFEYKTCRGEASAEGRRASDAPYAGGWDGRWLDDAVQSQSSFLREQGANVRVLSRTRTSLGGLPAVRVVSTYEKGGEEMVSDGIVAFRRDASGRASAVYSIDLSTRLADYERDRPVLEEMRKTCHLQPPR